MAPYEWPAEGNLHGVHQPAPISDPPTLTDLSNIYGLKQHLFLATDYPDETLGGLVLLEHRLCQAVPNDPALPEPQGVAAILVQLGQLQATLTANINAARAEATAAAHDHTTAIALIEQKLNTLTADSNSNTAVIARIEKKIDDLRSESRRNHAAVAKILNSMQPVGRHIPLLTVPFPNNTLPPSNLAVLHDRFAVLNLSAHQRKRYYREYHPAGAIPDNDEAGQTRAILQALGCKLVEGELEGELEG